jgi:hypothetical protein
MRILQYEGISRLSQTVRFFTWNRTSHTAVELDDGRVCEAWKSREDNGVRIVESLHAQHTPSTIVKAYTLPELSQMQAEDFTSWLIGQEGKPYAFWGGITRFLTRHDPQAYDPQSFRIEDYDPEAWFCSCLAFAGLMHVNFKLLDRIPPWRVSPGHINLSPRLNLDEIIRVGRAVPSAPSSVGRVPSHGALSSDLRPLTSGGAI